MGELRRIPGVGPRIEQAMQAIGIRCIADLVGRDPEELYRLDCRQKGFQDEPLRPVCLPPCRLLCGASPTGNGKIEVVVLEKRAVLPKRRTTP